MVISPLSARIMPVDLFMPGTQYTVKYLLILATSTLLFYSDNSVLGQSSVMSYLSYN